MFRFDPERTADTKNFDKETGAGGADDGDDDEVEEVGGTGLRNDKCPLTMKSVYELVQPVADSLGFIYEKAAILEYIAKEGRGGAAVKCPVSGE